MTVKIWHHLPNVRKFLDKTIKVRLNSRIVVESLGGRWRCEPREWEEYDTLWIPYEGGEIIIYRPWAYPDGKIRESYGVGYAGEGSPEEDLIKEYLNIILGDNFLREFSFYENGFRKSQTGT